MSISFMTLNKNEGLRNRERLGREVLNRLRYRWESTFRKSGLPIGSRLRISEISKAGTRSYLVVEVLDNTPYGRIKLAPSELGYLFERHG